MRYLSLLVGIALLFSGTHAQASERWFQIEVILFDQQSADALKAELWEPQRPKRPSYQVDFLTDINSVSPEMLRAGVTQLFLYPDLYMAPINDTEAATDTDNVALEQTQAQPIGELTPLEAPQAPIAPIEQPFLNLKAEQRNLMDVYRKLERSGKVKVLNYASWRQPVADKESAIQVRVYGGTNYIEQYQVNGKPKSQNSNFVIDWLQPTPKQDIELTAPQLDSLKIEQVLEPALTSDTVESGDQLQSDFDFGSFLNQYLQRAEAKAEILTKPSLWQLDGAISVYIEKRYLHLKSDLVYRKPVLPSEFDYLKKQKWQLAQQNQALNQESFSASETSQPQLELKAIEEQEQLEVREFAIKNLRRLRSTEYHYVDHPLVGMVFLITPYMPEHLKPQEEVEN